MGYRLTLRTFALTAAVSLAAVGIVIGGLVLWAQQSSKYSLDRALSAVADGRPVPSSVDLRLVGMEVALDDEAKLQTVLRNGFEIKGEMYFWETFPRRAFAYSVGLSVDIDMVCEVISEDRWVIYCGQVKCMVSPCEMHLSSGAIAVMDTSHLNTVTGVIVRSPPNTSLERTRER